MLKVAKFGGSSLSSGEQFAKVKDIVLSDESRNVVVVSAPGKRFPEDNKITDLLYLCNAHLKYDVSYDRVFEIIEQRFMDIRSECGLTTDLDEEFETIRSHMKKGAPVDYLVSRGEYLNAKLMAEYLDFTFVDPMDWLYFNYNGSVNFEKSEDALKEIYQVHTKMVIPGFYGSSPHGDIKVFSRGGSDISGAIVASSLNADVYENWTDVTGILMVDPRIVDNPKTISRVTYSELHELSYMGAEVLHEDTIYPVRRKDIPLNIRNTNAPEKSGTIIRESFPEENDEEYSRFITGITGKKGFSIVNIYKSNLKSNVSLLRNVLEICERYKMPISQIPSGIDSFSLIIPSDKLEPSRYEFISELTKECNLTNVNVTDEISIIAIVGRQMAYRTGVSGKIFAALGDNQINIRTIEQSADEINIMVGVFDKDFETAMQVLYDSFAK